MFLRNPWFSHVSAMEHRFIEANQGVPDLPGSPCLIVSGALKRFRGETD